MRKFGGHQIFLAIAGSDNPYSLTNVLGRGVNQPEQGVLSTRHTATPSLCCHVP